MAAPVDALRQHWPEYLIEAVGVAPMRCRLLALLLLPLPLLAGAARAETIERVDSIAITVADMGRALAFHTGVLPFEKVAETEVAGEAYERRFGGFGLRLRNARLRLGEQEIELIDYLAPEGRPIPEDSRSNDEWFQHIATIVRDMDQAYAHLRRYNVQHASSGPQTPARLEPQRGRDRGVLLQGPRRQSPRDPAVLAGQGGGQVARAGRRAVSRHRPHRDRGA